MLVKQMLTNYVISKKIIYLRSNSISMKQLFSFAFFTVFLFVSKAQTFNFSVTNEPLVPLEGAQSVGLPVNWDVNTFTMELPFPVNIPGIPPFTTLYCNADQIYSNYPFVEGIPPIDQVKIYGGNYDIAYKASGSVSYKTEGVAPNRKFTIEYLDANFFSQNPDVTTLNIQNTFYENGCISIHLGQSTCENPSVCYDRGVFLIRSYASNKIYFASGTNGIDELTYSEFPAAAFPPNTLPQFDYYPGPNKKIMFCPTNTINVEQVKETIQLCYPNPANDLFYLKGINKNSNVEVINLTGQVVKRFNQTAPESPLIIEDLAKGVYTVRIVFEDNQTIIQKLIKK
jgi:hypothetical protein